MQRYLLYTRKSSESEDRQALSLDSQRTELLRFAQSQNLSIVELKPESMSAKQPGRPIFNEMIARIERGEADGILAWHPDRLARNASDSAQIDHLLDTGKLKDLKFPTYRYDNTAQGRFMLGIFMCQAKYYIDSMSENIRRGLRSKIEMGWFPAKAPLGYLNDLATHTITRDPERFDKVRQVWTAYLSGDYSLSSLSTFCEHIGLKGIATNANSGKTLGTTTLYCILRNPFYTGLFLSKGALHKGKHDPMVSQREFDQVQEILGSKGHPRPKRLYFPFRGLIKCGACGHLITCERKKNRYGSCYTYFRCAQQRRKCKEPSIEQKDLERQLLAYLKTCRLPSSALDQIMAHIANLEQLDDGVTKKELTKARATLSKLANRSGALIEMKLSGLLNDEEFLLEKNSVTHEQAHLMEKIKVLENPSKGSWGEHLRDELTFMERAEKVFVNGAPEIRHRLINRLCSNLRLRDRKLHVEAKNYLKPLERVGQTHRRERSVLEPLYFRSHKRQSTSCKASSCVWSCLRDSNPRPPPYHGGALPAELRQQIRARNYGNSTY